MKHLQIILTTILALVCAGGAAHAQKISDSSYRTVAYIKSDGTIQDGSYRTIGYIKSDGRVQDGSYRTIGYARGIPMQWAAFYFFFGN